MTLLERRPADTPQDRTPLILEPGVTPGAGEMRLPVDRCGAHSHSRAGVFGTGRPVSTRPAAVGLAQELGCGDAPGLNVVVGTSGVIRRSASIRAFTPVFDGLW